MSDLLPVLPQRSCGSCHACCTVFGINELHKAPNVACEHLVVGVMFTQRATRTDIVVGLPAVMHTAHEVWANARREPRAMNLLSRVVTITRSLVVVILFPLTRKKYIVLGPEKLVEGVRRWTAAHCKGQWWGILKETHADDKSACP